jgi:hypothetical protein
MVPYDLVYSYGNETIKFGPYDTFQKGMRAHIEFMREPGGRIPTAGCLCNKNTTISLDEDILACTRMKRF